MWINKMIKKAFIPLFIILLISCSKESEPDPEPQPASYSFFVAGHTYGKPGINNIGLHPPFKEKFGYIKSREEIKLGFLTGDIVPLPSPEDWDEVDDDITSLGLPVYFAVGNHDMKDRELYESRYGSTYFSFFYNTDLFIVLDPNLDNWNISGEQLVFLKETVHSNSHSVDNIFVFFHQLLWRENDNIYKEIKPNSFEGRSDTINFWSEIEPLFNELENQVYMFAGDIGGAAWSSDFMYDRFDNISLIASGMGEGPGDNFVITNVHSDKSVTYDLICLSDSTLNCFGDLTDYRLTTHE
ncbi:metallophosphoesterase family protein [Maribellus mangrovi]|uniref:metallophosphoesterase family protein n=1 Tax=Maribellus mangrovi TaxID=3133146 RepID=UPI0030EF2568